MYRAQIGFTLAILGTLLVMAGCGGKDFGPTGSISGTLSMDEQPLPEGTKLIFMHPSEGHAGFGFTDASGQFSIEWRRGGKNRDSMPVGVYEVMIVESSAVDVEQMSADEMLEGNLPEPTRTTRIPAKYLRASTSGLSYEVKEGENNFDIKISRS
ncbi:hypothetical protein [Mariniblastus fucicola]|uniref:Carboxypeptidase regulatory-like domain-containing protein n=1 Tax=Mariniblastus fucicola TaxID=980251 RepID=A0A5B9P5H3_9BACT|nr:hypothetical protein [Mariniblastus fucicola]QEG20222.1 hypothetical protein MFFC18_00690 [Mariniblastus fucicola]